VLGQIGRDQSRLLLLLLAFVFVVFSKLLLSWFVLTACIVALHHDCRATASICLQAATMPGLLEVLIKCNEALGMVQKNLEDYLETKRVAFPRWMMIAVFVVLQLLLCLCGRLTAC
jgi:hypothetical protein